MKKATKVITVLVVLAAVLFVSCSSGKKDSASASSDKAIKPIVIYFSYSGNTEKVANAIASELSAPIVKIEAATPYVSTDLDNKVSTSRLQTEQKDDSARPLIASSTYTAIDANSYDTVIIGYPIWNGAAPRIIQTLLDHYNKFDGKTIYTFSTSASSSGDNAFNALKAYANAKDNLHLTSAELGNTSDRVNTWVKTLV